MKRLFFFLAVLGLTHVRGADDLPKALLIGDSISIGDTQPVMTLLRGKIAVSRPQANCSSTEVGLANLDKWLEGGPWQVIHFNWGLHDLWQGNRPKVNGKQSVPLPQYEKNLEALVLRLKATGARLIFATTTLVPEGEVGRFVGDDVKYNSAALAIMKKQCDELGRYSNQK